MRKLLSLISIGLGLEENSLLKKLGEQPRQRAQANFYPPCTNPELTMGLTEHTDINALTVLLQSEISGLQVNKDGKWISVPCIPNAFVINLADQIEVCDIDVFFLYIFTCFDSEKKYIDPPYLRSLVGGGGLTFE